MLGDISTAGLSWSHVAQAPIRAVVFAEVIGLRRERAMETNLHAYQWLSSIKPEAMVSACARPGLSPHAPYSTAGWLYNRVAGSQVPLSTHLAEMPEEVQLLQTGRGRLREFLEDLGAWDEDWEPVGRARPTISGRVTCARPTGWWLTGITSNPRTSGSFAPRPLPTASASRSPTALARPPGSGTVRIPFRAMLERGVIVCLGTDSLASAPSLSILDELRCLHRSDPTLGGPLLLTMATLFGAWAMRAETVTGSLKPGKSADLAVIALPDRDEEDPYRLLLDASEPVLGDDVRGLASSPVRGPRCDG